MSTRIIDIEYADDQGVYDTVRTSCPDVGTAAEARKRHVTLKRDSGARNWRMCGDTYVDTYVIPGSRGESDITVTSRISWTDDEEGTPS